MLLFHNLYKDFELTHKSDLNNFIHIFSLLCGFFGFINIIPYNYILFNLYILHLYFIIPNNIIYKSFIFINIILFMSYIYTITISQSLYLLLFSFILQEFSHFITNERTMVSLYFTFSKDFLYKYIIHSYFLLPFIIKHNNHKYFQNLFLNNNIIYFKLSSDLNKYIYQLQESITFYKPSTKYTTHIWYTDLYFKYKNDFIQIIKHKSLFDNLYSYYDKNIYNIENIIQMDEYYVSSYNSKYSSDNVFYLDHIDGPFGLLPGIIINRSIIAITPNEFINTNFPIEKKIYTLTTGECVSFDFNRCIHYIDKNINKITSDFRIVLKVHFLIYPKKLKYYAYFYKYLTIYYDKIARNLFLYTIQPNTISTNFITSIILFITNKYYYIEKYIGFNNISYTFIILLLSYIFNNFIIYIFYIFLMYFYNTHNYYFYTFLSLINLFIIINSFYIY